MKVNPEALRGAITDTNLKSPGGTTSEGSSVTGATGQTSQGDSSKIELSSASLGLQSSEGADSASFDAGRVDQIKQAISEGRFQVNPHAVADKLIASVQDLLAGKSGGSH